MIAEDGLKLEHPAFLLQERFHFLRRLHAQDDTGYGQVYQVQERDTAICYALKVPLAAKPEEQPIALRMLQREAEALSAVQHIHLIRLREDHSKDAIPYLLLEYVAGDSLERLHKEATLSLREYGLIVAGLAAALACLHEHGWLHNDLHPLNVVIDRRAGWPVLIDLGLASRPSETDWPPRAGRLDWMDTRIIESDLPRSTATDLFSLWRLIENLLGGDLSDALVQWGRRDPYDNLPELERALAQWVLDRLSDTHAAADPMATL